MTARQDELYIGIDFNDSFVQVSFYRPGMKDVETLSTVAGGEQYRIPTVSYREAENSEALLLHFLRRVIRLVPGVSGLGEITAVTFRLDVIETEMIRLLKNVMEQMGVRQERVFFQDSRESFCHFALNQQKELINHDVVLFQCEENELSCLYLTREKKTTPQKVEIHERKFGVLPAEFKERDLCFARAAEEVLRGQIVSAVYLTGEGLEGGWLKESLHILCRGRKVFQGRNLYTQGACYESCYKMQRENHDYVYLGEYQLSKNIRIQVKHGERTFFYELAEAGSSCYEVYKSCQVLLDGTPCVDIWLQEPDAAEAVVESLELTGLPERPGKATRLLVEAVGAGMKQVSIRITDMGFGAWYASGGKVWEYTIDE